MNALVAAGARINAKDGKPEKYSRRHGGSTPLLLAVKWMNAESIDALVRLGADANAKDMRRMNALHHVVENQLPCLYRYNDVSPERQTAHDMDLKASFDRMTEIASTLIRAGADVNLKDSDGCTPLMRVFKRTDYHKYGDSPLFVRLCEVLRQGSNLSLRNRKGESVLTLLANWASVELVRTLLDAAGPSLSLDWRDETGQTALIFATRASPSRIDTCKLLLERGAKPNLRDVQNRTALGYAGCNADLRQLIQEHGGRT